MQDDRGHYKGDRAQGVPWPEAQPFAKGKPGRTVRCGFGDVPPVRQRVEACHAEHLPGEREDGLKGHAGVVGHEETRR